jgi:hypothetical protein
MSKQVSAAIVLVLTLFLMNPAGAISDGVPDTEHPNVGALLLELSPEGLPGEIVPICSGSLLSPEYFLTSSHCLAFLEPEGFGPENLFVSFEQDVSPTPSDLIATTDFAIHPNALRRPSDADDVGVVTLAESVTGIAPIELPTDGFLATVAAQNGLRGHSFTNVGYGVVPNDRGRPAFDFDGLRRRSTSPFKGLTDAYLFLHMRTDATGEGGSCFGDSGSPKFFAPAGEPGANLAVALTFGGDAVCRAHNYNQRLDIPSVRGFLSNFVTVP